MKMPPKTGTVCRLSGNRRKPWVAKRWIGVKVDDEKKTARSVYVSIGTFAKKSEAIRALMREVLNPEEKAEAVSLADVYTMWSERKFEGLSHTMVNSYKNAWSYLSMLHNLPISKLTTSDFELAVERSNPPRTVRKGIQFLLNGVYSYAIAHDYTQKDVAAYTDFRGDMSSKIVRKVFTADEVNRLFASDDVKDQMILVGIFTGMRPNEIINLQNDEVDLENEFLRIRGSKTKSGEYRALPIHPKILSIIKANVLKSAKFDSTAVFLNGKKKWSYDAYADRVKIYDHTPHDTRHTFVTCAKMSGMDSLAVKKMVGHSISGVTESVYTHLGEEFLRREMAKLDTDLLVNVLCLDAKTRGK